MQKILKEIIKTFVGVGIESLRVTPHDDNTAFEGYTEKGAVVLKAYTKGALSAFTEQVGMNGIGVLNGLLSTEYFGGEKSKVEVKQKMITLFDESNRSAKYRLAAPQSNDRIAKQPTLPFTGKWDIDISVNKEKLLEIRKLSSILSSVDPRCSIAVEGGDLRLYMGSQNDSSHGTYVNIGKTDVNIPRMYWNIADLITVLTLFPETENIHLQLSQKMPIMYVSYSNDAMDYVIYLPSLKE